MKPATTRIIKETLESVDWTYQIHDDGTVYTHCRCERYRSGNGVPALGIVLHTIDEDRALIAIAPFVRSISHLSASRRLELHDEISDLLNVSQWVKCHIDADSGYVRVSAVIPLDGAIEPSILLRIINSVVCFVDDFLIAKIDLLLSKEEIEVNIPEDDEIIVLTRSEMIVRFERYRDELDDHS